MKLTLWAVLGLAFLVAGCHGSTEPSTPDALPTTTESFAGTLPVGGVRFYSFVIAVRGIVNVTINSITVGGVASTSTVGLGVGVPAGTGCVDIATGNAAAGTTPQATGTYGPGTFCVRIYDNGNLTDPTAFDISIAHP